MQREAIIGFREPFDRRLASYSYLNATQAIRWAEPTHIYSYKLKSGDLAIYTTWSQEAECLKEFAEDWAKGLRLNDQVVIHSYGIVRECHTGKRDIGIWPLHISHIYSL
jgi:hypothetical protein